MKINVQILLFISSQLVQNELSGTSHSTDATTHFQFTELKTLKKLLALKAENKAQSQCWNTNNSCYLCSRFISKLQNSQVIKVQII